jgi:hypothetical protein
VLRLRDLRFRPPCQAPGLVEARLDPFHLFDDGRV